MSVAINSGMVSVCVELGSNIKPEHYLPKAIQVLRNEFKVIGISNAWETPPVGCVGCENYLNAAVLIETDITNEELRIRLRQIESQLDRVRTTNKFSPRTIDLDVLIYNNELIEPDLWIYSYLAVPVSELMPTYVNVDTGEKLKTVAQRMLMQDEILLREDVNF